MRQSKMKQLSQQRKDIVYLNTRTPGMFQSLGPFMKVLLLSSMDSGSSPL